MSRWQCHSLQPQVVLSVLCKCSDLSFPGFEHVLKVCTVRYKYFYVSCLSDKWYAKFFMLSYTKSV
jgi:hypothetical protein